jgi:hypothetical protein
MSPVRYFGHTARSSRLFRFIGFALMTSNMKHETSANRQKQAALGLNRPNVSNLLANSETARLVTGFTRDEWLRRIKATPDDPVRAFAEDQALKNSSAVSFREKNEPNTVYRLTGSLAANAVLVDAEPTTPAEAARLARKYAKRARAEISRRAQRRSLTPHERKVSDVIRKNPSLKGMKYAKALTATKVHVKTEWVVAGCPREYVAAYQEKTWRRKINREKSDVNPLK